MSHAVLISTNAVQDIGNLQSSPHFTQNPASSWSNALNLRPRNRINNAQNYVWFSLLAVLADRGYRLHTDDRKAEHGFLEHDASLMQPV